MSGFGGRGGNFRPQQHYHPHHDADDEDLQRMQTGAGTGSYKVPDRDFYRKNYNTFASIYSHFQDKLSARRFEDRSPLQPHFTALAQLRTPYSAGASGTLNSVVDGVCCHFLRRGFTKPNKIQFNAAVWSADARWLVLGTQTGDLALWESEALKVHKVISVPAHKEFYGDGTDRVKEQIPVTAMAWKRHGNMLVTGDARGLIQYCDETFRNVMVTKDAHTPGSAVRGLSFSPLDSRLVSCGDDGFIHLWAGGRDRPEQVLSGHASDVKSVDWHPHRALIASSSRDSTVKLWDPRVSEATGGGRSCICTISGHKKQVASCSWNRNGNWLASGSMDGLVKVYDIRHTMRELQTFRGHHSEVCRVAWHPVHESLLLSGGYNGSLIYWIVGGTMMQEEDSQSVVGGGAGSGGGGTPHSAIYGAHRQSIDVIAWHPSGHLLGTASHDCMLKFWCREPPGCTLQLSAAEAAQEAPPAYLHGPLLPTDLSAAVAASSSIAPTAGVGLGGLAGGGGGGGGGFQNSYPPASSSQRGPGGRIERGGRVRSGFAVDRNRDRDRDRGDPQRRAFVAGQSSHEGDRPFPSRKRFRDI